jgi:hypothetical protein
MEHTPHLADTLVHVLRPQAKWVDQRPRKTLAWRRGGLSQSGWISLTAWPPSGVRRARDAQRTGRRFRRWRDNDTRAVWSLYGPRRPQALAEWGEQALAVAWATAMLWQTSCRIRLSVL